MTKCKFVVSVLLFALALPARVAWAHAPDATVIEFHNASLGHYFVTASASEAAALDAGVKQGWVRTGASFLAYATTEAGTQPVCRFYGLPAAGLDSHFYSAFPTECAEVLLKFAGTWQLESSDVFSVAVPDKVAGACPAGTTPVYRVWNGRVDSNHRYTASSSVRATMMAQGWIPEGYGPLGVAMCAPASAVDLTRVPMGDGKLSTSPKVGYVWSCETSFNGGGAFVDGPWIRGDGTWDRTIKSAVIGSVAWTSTFLHTLSASTRMLAGNGLPDHATGIFPIATTDPAYAYDRNPNSIRAQALALSVAANPAMAANASCLPQGAIGVLLSGAQFFNALDALGRDAGAHEIQDRCDGHPEASGAYHYHALSGCLKAVDVPGEHSALVGYAKDGFGLYGNLGEGGKPLANADLDECHGHHHAVTWNGATVAMYHYHATVEYPFTLGCYRGTPAR
jgi:YHYH protein/Repeat of unknown function (DUF5648)